MKRVLIVLVALMMLSVSAFAESQVRLTGNLAIDFIDRPSVQDVVQTFQSKDQVFFWGVGWEVIFDKTGLGGMYDVNFYEDHETKWWLDWLAEPIYVSYHFFRGGAVIDPFVEFGLGCAGRVFLDNPLSADKDPLYLSLFPTVGAGLSLDLDGFLFGAKLNYVPTLLSIPVTDIDHYPLERFQVAVYAGVALGSHR
jgi:hypothetical protein